MENQPMTTAKDDSITVRGLSFHYRDWGGQGRDLLLLHGLSSNARFWDLAVPHLTGEFRVMALDQRGHGATAKPDDGYDFPSVAADIDAFIQAAGLARPILVGHSWGGNVGVQVAADYPGILAGLVCIDGGFFEPSAISGATWEQAETAMAPPDFAAMRLTSDALLEGARTRMASLWGDAFEEFLWANFEVQPDGIVLPRLPRDRHMLIVRAMWDQGVSRLFPRVTCPVLLMPARSDNPQRTGWGVSEQMQAQATRAQSLLPKARLVWMEDSIHDVPVQRPAEVAEVISQANREGYFED